MSIDRARLLIRTANQIPDSEDRRTLLAWADEILAGTQVTVGAAESRQMNFPIPVKQYSLYHIKPFHNFLYCQINIRALLCKW